MNKCSVKGCEKPQCSKSYCQTHYKRWYRHGTTDRMYDVSQGAYGLDGVKETRPGHRGYLSVNIINDFKYKAQIRKISWNLTHQQTFELIQKPCFYCGFQPKWPESHTRIDRIQNHIGYTIENCLPCCLKCKAFKGKVDRDWVIRIYKKLSKK